MEIDVYDILQSNDLLLLFTVIGFGYLLGNIKLGVITIGSTIGVLVASLIFGHYGMEISAAVGTFGFALFIFSVGLDAGPSFFSSFREDGTKYIVLAVIVAISGFSVAWTLSKILQLETGYDAGLLAGALTSTPTLVGAVDAVRSGFAHIPEGVTAEQVIDNISIGCALTYLVGSVTIILIVTFIPKMLNLNLEKEAQKYARNKH